MGLGKRLLQTCPGKAGVGQAKPRDKAAMFRLEVRGEASKPHTELPSRSTARVGNDPAAFAATSPVSWPGSQDRIPQWEDGCRLDARHGWF
jgi:hypothetical protein